MKNIHIIPTDKSGRVGRFVDTQELILRSGKDIPRGENVNILITNEEKIKEGDWCLGMDGIFQYKGKVNIPDIELPKKIILTTDQNLINDGVQSIDDEFLEWFVKNPSCDYVGITPNWEFLGDDYRYGGEQTLVYYPIIPKEEPKEKSLEEAIGKLYPLTGEVGIDHRNYLRKEGFIEGVKYQAEQDKNKYSEEEVDVLIHELINKFTDWSGSYVYNDKLIEIYKQLKKK
jgi:hypothetical protein